MINTLEQIVRAGDNGHALSKTELLDIARQAEDLDLSAFMEAIAHDLDKDGFSRNPHIVRPAARLAQRALKKG